ncbi:MAG: MBL fold metallo-hydrolase [Pseudomonadales bacterium]|nr:MBL fold metallo-hydrolase [Pseudomonadales bacterium]
MTIFRNFVLLVINRCVGLSALMLVFVLLVLSGCGKPTVEVVDIEVDQQRSLVEHTQEFRKEVIKVTDGVWVAVGYGLANSIMLEGDDGLVIVDTMETLEEAEEVKHAFRKISEKPIKAIIYTHNHADHVFGSSAFSEGNDIDVYAHDTTSFYIDRVVNVIRPIVSVRGARMFGSHLEGAALENAGIGPHLGIGPDSRLDVLRPTKTFRQSLDVTVAGIHMVLEHAPGETNDQIFVWLPEKRVLLPGDNIYKTFPNLYTIRGTLHRDVLAWAKSIDKMRQLKPEFLVPSHTRPLQGETFIGDTLTDYRDGIQFVHDQTVYWMNRGLTPDEIVEKVKLPDNLARSPFLQEFYGQVDWSVRSIFTGYLGWFDGNSTTLNPLPPLEKAQRIADLAGGSDMLLEKAKTAVLQKQWQWVLELTDHLMVLGDKITAVKSLRKESLLSLGEMQSNPNARHYYLTQALELDNDFRAGIPVNPEKHMVHSLPLAGIFQSMAVNLNIEKAGNLRRVVNFNFPDAKQQYSLTLRNGVVEVQNYLQNNADITVTMQSSLWKEIVSEIRNPLAAFASGDIDIEGSKVDLIAFLALVKAPDRE